jgi:peptidylprolyl isomerase
VRRLVAPLGILFLTLSVLSACGEDDPAGDTGSVAVTGAFGEQPEVSYDGRVARTDTESEVLIEGTGAEVAEGDTVFVELYIGNGYDGEEGLSTFEQPAEEATEEPSEEPTEEETDKGDKKGDKKDSKESEEPEEPETVDQPPFMLPLAPDQLFPGVREAVEGAKVGSRIQVLATPEDAFGEGGNPALGIGNTDTVVFVVDLVERVLPAPEGTEQTLPEGLPSIVESDGKVTSLDFTGTPADPPTDLEVHTIIEGDGAAIKKSGSQVAMRYLGQVWKADTPFDQNYDAVGPGFPNQNGGIDPATIPGQLIKGWNEGLVGVTAGSRVMLVVPSRFGYGKEGSGDLIKGGDTLVFVVDVLGVA